MKAPFEALGGLARYGRGEMQIGLTLVWFWALAGLIIVLGESYVWFGEDGLSRNEWKGLLWGGFGTNAFVFLLSVFSDWKRESLDSEASTVAKKTSMMMMIGFMYGCILYTLPSDHHTSTNPAYDARLVKLGERAAALNLAIILILSAVTMSKLVNFGEYILRKMFGGIFTCSF